MANLTLTWPFGARESLRKLLETGKSARGDWSFLKFGELDVSIEDRKGFMHLHLGNEAAIERLVLALQIIMREQDIHEILLVYTDPGRLFVSRSGSCQFRIDISRKPEKLIASLAKLCGEMGALFSRRDYGMNGTMAELLEGEMEKWEPDRIAVLKDDGKTVFIAMPPDQESGSMIAWSSSVSWMENSLASTNAQIAAEMIAIAGREIILRNFGVRTLPIQGILEKALSF